VESTSATSNKLISVLMLVETLIKKDKLLSIIADTMVLIRDGRFSILIRKLRQRPRDSTKSSASTSTDHSTLSQNSHSTELLRCLVEPTWSLRDGERTRDNNSSSLMRLQRPLETTTGRTIALTSKAMVRAIISEPLRVSTLDGGRCSDLRMVHMLPTKGEE
jgi:hypothetical protein